MMTTMMNDDDILAIRRDLRCSTIARREALDASTHAALTRDLEAHLAVLLARLDPPCVAFCWPYRAEPDLRAFITRWLDAGRARQAALPVVLDRDQPMVFRAWTPACSLAVDRHGIPYPADTPELTPVLALVPLNAFDAAGYRIGYGGGYFDRTLAAMSMITVGVGFELGRVTSVYPQAHDKPMDWIATEAGCWPAAR